MDKRAIIIADKDIAYRSKMAAFFRKVGYLVESTGSTDQILDRIQGKQAPVLLLGSDFASQVASADLVHLLKKCNHQLQIIMVSDGMTLSQARQLRQEGIFYHALKPGSVGEAEELGQAVACAFDKRQGSHSAGAVAALPHSAGSEELASARLMNALPWIVGVVALILGTNYISLSAASRGHDGNSMVVWIFLGFCALIVIGQILPIFRVKLVLGRVGDHQATRVRGGK